MKKFILFLSLLAIFPSFVSACGAEHDEGSVVTNGFVGFGFVGGVVAALIVVAIVLSVMILNKKEKK